MDPIQVATSAAAALDITGVLKVTQDAVRVALGDTGGGRDVCDSQIRVLGNGEQYLRVIRDERPVPLRRDLVQPRPGRSRVRHEDTVPFTTPSHNPPNGPTGVEFRQRKLLFKQLSSDFEDLLGSALRKPSQDASSV
jgi:hypothetical protein